MFRARFPNADFLLDLLRAISVISEEACLKIGTDEMTLKAVDPARVALVDFELYNSAAEEWELDGHESLRMNVNVSEVLRMIGKVKKGETITILH